MMQNIKLSNNIKTSIRYFPYCPGIPWRIKNNTDIIPRLDLNSWHRALDQREIVLVNFGGLFETYLSLSYAEAFNKLNIRNKIYFNGNSNYNHLIYLNGLMKNINIIDSEKSKKYPIPIFLDKSNHVYFNCLNNYIDFYSFSGKYRYKSYKPISNQLFLNSCIDWNINYKPQFRNLIISKEFEDLKKIRKFDIDKPFVLIFPDSNSGFSVHSISMLGWNVSQIKSFVSMVNSKGIQTVIVTKNSGRYTGISSLVLMPQFEMILSLIEKCSVILSEEIDFLLIALLLSSKGKIIGKQVTSEFSIKNNQKYLQTDKKLFLSKQLDPINIYKEIK